MLHIAFTAYLAATGERFPAETFTVPGIQWLDPDWDFDFDDGARDGPSAASLGRAFTPG